MILPKIHPSTVENLTNEFLRSEPEKYIYSKIQQLNEHNPDLLNSIEGLAETVFVANDDASEVDKYVNKLRAIAVCLVIVNIINTQMEIDWLKG